MSTSYHREAQKKIKAVRRPLLRADRLVPEDARTANWRRKITLQAKLDLTHAERDWRRAAIRLNLAHVLWTPAYTWECNPSAECRLPHECSAAALVNALGHYDVQRSMIRTIIMMIRAKRGRRTSHVRELIALLRRRRHVWRRVLQIGIEYRSLASVARKNH